MYGSYRVIISKHGHLDNLIGVSMDDTIYDLCVVGAGLIGAATARHATTRSGAKVCLIGPEEPEARSMDDTRYIYGAHYDEGRITRACSTNNVWSKLAVQSINRYRDLEKQSGVLFYNEVGNLMAGSKRLVHKTEEVAKQENINYKLMTSQELSTSFPFFKFSLCDSALYESKNAGNVSPRKLLKAQKIVAEKQGCVIINDIVCQVIRDVNAGGFDVIIVRMESGRKVVCKSVLLAPGAFTSFHNLLPNITLKTTLIPIAVALVEIKESVVNKLRTMPSVIYEGQGHPDWYTDKNVIPPGKHAFYMLSPVLYPNGKYYIKLGLYHDFTRHIKVHTAEGAKRWFVNGDPEIAEATKKLLVSIFKDLPVESWHSDFCIVVETPTYLPYIDKIHSQLGVATGGNGHAAKSSDEIGRLAADMMFGEWKSDIPRDTFRVQFEKEHNSKL